MRKTPIFFIFFILSLSIYAQPVVKSVLKESRQKYYRYLVDKSILGNLASPLDSEHEDSWETAFWTITFINFKEAIVSAKIEEAFINILQRSNSFQRALLELIYTDYKNKYFTEVKSMSLRATDPRVFAMCAEYIMASDNFLSEKKNLLQHARTLLSKDAANPILNQLLYRLNHKGMKTAPPSLSSLMAQNYLPGQVLVISFQRSNRDYTGLSFVRDAAGNFLKNDDSSYTAIPQLARSASNMSGYLSNGNTPEGIFRMRGFDVSKSNILGPSINIQMTMPGEYKASQFFQDSTLNDSTWDIQRYKALLPQNLRSYYPMLQSYYAGRAGRTEIIAHGNTVDPSFYLNQPYYPISPTQGCLCTKEIWSEITGRLITSDQVRLTDAVKRAGGAKGYYIVVNIDDKDAPVTMKDILPLFKNITRY